MNFKLIQQALVALEMYREYTPESNGVAEQAIVALKQFKKEWQETEAPYVVVECNCSGKTTLFSPPQPLKEPTDSMVLTLMGNSFLGKEDARDALQDILQETHLYTTPPQRKWVGLTDVEWMNIVNKDQAWFGQRPDEVAHEVAKMVEAKLREKNT